MRTVAAVVALALVLVTILVNLVFLYFYVRKFGHFLHFNSSVKPYCGSASEIDNGVQSITSENGIHEHVAQNCTRFVDFATPGSNGIRVSVGTDDSSHLLVHQLVTLPANKEVQRILCDSTHYWTDLLGLPVGKYFEICNNSSRQNDKLLEVMMFTNATRKYIESLARYSSRDKDIILPMVDMSFVDMMMNFYLSSIKRLNIRNYLFLTLDIKAYNFLQARGINCFHYPINQQTDKPSTYATQEYNCKIHSRTLYILHALLLGYNVLKIDIDIVFLQNPLMALAQECPECDMTYQVDKKEINGGFIFCRPTPVTILLFLALQYQLNASQCKTSEQHLTNKLIQQMQQNATTTPILKLHGLDIHKFQSGYQFWESELRIFPQDVKECGDCITVHNNYILGKVEKIYRFREAGLWLYDENNYYNDSIRRYIMCDDTIIPKEHATAVMRKLVTVSLLLNRTVILPQFSIGGQKPCSIIQMRSFGSFESCFGNYREHYFLNHTLVPGDIKSNVSPWFGVIQTNGSLEVSTNTTVDSVAVELSHQQVISLLGSTMTEKYSVLRINVWSFKIQTIGCMANISLW